MLNKNNTFALSIYKSFLDIEAINSALKEKNIPLTIDCDNLKIICLKKDLKNYIKNLVNTDDEFAKEFISIITDEKYDMLNANINNNSLNISLSLENLKTDDLLVDESIKKEIDKNSFITNKTQNLLLSTLTKENRITFSYLEFNRLIFTQTNSYKDLSFENECYKYAVLRNVLYNKGKAIELMAGYEPWLKFLFEWWRQLFGESEGKCGKGIYRCDPLQKR